MEHDDSNGGPFGLDPNTLRACYERSGDRPSGMTRFEAFAYQIDAELANRRAAAPAPGMLPLLRRYSNLRRHAARMAAALRHGINIIDSTTSLDTSPGRSVLADFEADFGHED